MTAIPQALSPVLIMGTGLIGTSIAMSLTRAGVEVFLDDVDLGHVTAAVGMGAGSALRPGQVPSLVVVAVPPAHAARVIADACTRFPEATITDVTSVKLPVLAEAIALGADEVRLVGGHPMAGREVSGPTGARADLLDDRVWILTPGQGTSSEALMQAHRLVTTCGAYAIEMDPQEHDEAVALVSHAPQLVASALAARLADADEGQVRIAGQGLRDTTRIAGSQSGMWVQILSANAVPVATVIEAVAADLSAAALELRALSEGPGDDVAGRVDAVLRQGAVGQARIPGKHGAIATNYSEVEVMVADRPGELARLFVAAGEGGVNLEDVRIEHVLGRPSGLVGLFVRPDSADTLRETLRLRDFDVRS